MVWPFLFVRFLDFAEGKGWILVRAKTAWDMFFGNLKEGCWIQVELTDGRVIGGKFGRESYASAWPDPGHLYIQELWTVDVFGNFQYQVTGSPGTLLRPGDYRFVRVY